MKLNDFAKGLTQNGIIVLNVSNGEITDYLVSEAAERTIISREDTRLSASILDRNTYILSEDTINILRVLKD
ncbi:MULTISPECIES: hypothetical protein [Lelliottia]|uniref:Uncharacterized protein n=1 Tax=Lelliottia aquatilis TaxID=2080838 RepID=A0ABX5A2T8_9ENTR|nr:MULTISPECIES: hypothetical protein [Lelliottia]POZ14098.1 hypothetical protein C3Z09_20185 [Lelliottia aquatilis]POZ24000.1 hypothetical protein C3712_07190 [Lelliottia aquatilis]POZ27598.1 hypothetical protein C3708_08465 [Lelliottia sp. 7254-16]POZ29867.1 hypothetical protein C3711_01675 [Lelliottia aquatilis]POZ35432.1 hypothetical protein C3710_01675 [Lelliottia aquatilis]